MAVVHNARTAFRPIVLPSVVGGIDVACDAVAVVSLEVDAVEEAVVWVSGRRIDTPSRNNASCPGMRSLHCFVIDASDSKRNDLYDLYPLSFSISIVLSSNSFSVQQLSNSNLSIALMFNFKAEMF